MDASTLIKILVFGLAALIILVFVFSGIHFARAVYQQQQMLRARDEHRATVMAVLGDPASIAMVDIKQKDGFIIVQPDGLEDLALRVESEDERAYKQMAEKALEEAKAESAIKAGQASPLEHTATACSRQLGMSIEASSASLTCGDQSASTGQSTASLSSVDPSSSSPPPDLSEGTSHTESSSRDVFSSRDVVVLVVPAEEQHPPDSRLQEGQIAPADAQSASQLDVGSQSPSARQRTATALQSVKRWFTSTDSYFD